MPNKIETITHPHKKDHGSAVPCSSHHLILVREGVQCANCLALVIEDKVIFEDSAPEKENCGAK